MMTHECEWIRKEATDAQMNSILDFSGGNESQKLSLGATDDRVDLLAQNLEDISAERYLQNKLFPENLPAVK
jgi:hypothetical protein